MSAPPAASPAPAPAFLYNLQKGIEQIASGKARVVIVGSSEAPINQECIEGYGAMGALATEDGLRQIEGNEDVDFRRASRPFGENCGFTLAEACQFVVLMDDELALQLGADIHGAVPDVFINADGFKKSISAPGPGNYLTVAKAVASAVQLLGIEAVRERSFVHAHGSSTPANRVTESEILDQIASTFAIEQWPVTAVKAFVGHSLATASGDQVISALGSFKYGIIPGIKTIDAVADDVRQQHLSFATATARVQPSNWMCALSTPRALAAITPAPCCWRPHVAERMLRKRHGEAAFAAYLQRREATRAAAQAYDAQALLGQLGIIYNFGNDLIDDQQISISRRADQGAGLCPAAGVQEGCALRRYARLSAQMMGFTQPPVCAAKAPSHEVLRSRRSVGGAPARRAAGSRLTAQFSATSAASPVAPRKYGLSSDSRAS